MSRLLLRPKHPLPSARHFFLLLLVLLFSALPSTHGCFPMLPPETTTTTVAPTTTTTTTMMTTTEPLVTTTLTYAPCTACPVPAYTAPSQEVCGTGFRCADATLLETSTTVYPGCISLVCREGASLFAFNDAGVLTMLRQSVTCAFGAMYYFDTFNSESHFPLNTQIFCKEAVRCDCGAVPLDPTGDINFMLSLTANEYGCPIYMCNTASRMSDPTRAIKFESVSCDALSHEYEDSTGAPLTTNFACYPCRCARPMPSSPLVCSNPTADSPGGICANPFLLCPADSFCYLPNSTPCATECTGTDMLVVWDPAMPTVGAQVQAPLMCTMENVLAPALPSTKLVACVARDASLMDAPPAGADCAALPELTGQPTSDHSLLYYYTSVSGTTTIVHAGCRQGTLVTEDPMGAAAAMVTGATCTTGNGWYAFPSSTKATRATCLTGSGGCQKCLEGRIGALPPVTFTVTADHGVCTVSCATNAPIQYTASDTSTGMAQTLKCTAGVAANSLFPAVILASGDAREVTMMMC